MQKSRIAFFGLGTMGIGMARRLLGAGHEVTVYNRNAQRAGPLVELGAKVAGSPREAAAGAEFLMAMLADDGASRGVWLGENGALAGAAVGAVAMDASTLTLHCVIELEAAAAARGCHFLDCPVTGTKPHAANGELTFLVGGPAEALERARPVLAVMSKEIVHLGPSGSGAALKLINNFVCGVQAAAHAEAMALLDRAGLDAKTALPVLLNGAPGSPLVKTLAGRHANNDTTPNFQLRLMAKDLDYAMALAKTHKLELHTAKAALERFHEAAAAGHGDEDLSAVIQYVRKEAKS